MTTKEFSDGFDILINSQSIVNNFGSTAYPSSFDEYEKSILLTTAQEEVVKGLYNGRLLGISLEETEEMRRYLDSLIKTDYPESVDGLTGIDSKSSFFKLKEDVWFITYESVELAEGAYCQDNPVVKVIPMKQDEWHRSKDNPFRKPNKRKVIRLDNGSNISELVSEYPVKNYLVRYLCKPSPIIVTSLEEGLSIDGITEVTECKLNTALHRIILERAVELARRRFPASK